MVGIAERGSSSVEGVELGVPTFGSLVPNDQHPLRYPKVSGEKDLLYP